MKYKARLVLAFLAMLLMLAAAFAIGTYRGFDSDRLQMEVTLQSLSHVLQSRIEMGNNVLTLAKRHPQADALLVQKLQDDIAGLSAPGLPERAIANNSLGKNALALLSQLASLPSVKADGRDLGYATSLLPQGLAQSAQWADAGRYNDAATEFNLRLGKGLKGWLARRLGILPLELFFEGGSQ